MGNSATKKTLEALCNKHKIIINIGDTVVILAEKLNNYLNADYFRISKSRHRVYLLRKNSIALKKIEFDIKNGIEKKDVFYKICPNCKIGKNKKAFTGLCGINRLCNECRRSKEIMNYAKLSDKMKG